MQTALDKYGSGGPVLMVGDSTWDVEAAKRAGVPTLALLTGGFSETELREAGAAEVKRSIQALREEGGEGTRPRRLLTHPSPVVLGCPNSWDGTSDQ